MKDEKDKHNGCEENEKESVVEETSGMEELPEEGSFPLDLDKPCTSSTQAEIQPGEPGIDPQKPGLNFLDLVYGVLFDPARTFQKVAINPPVGQAVLIYVIVSVLTGAMGVFINFRTLPVAISELSATVTGLIQGILPLLALGGIFLQFVKWFTYSAFLHLLADLFGGKGTARGVFTVYGLAGLPTLFIIPVQLLVLAISPSSSWPGILTVLFSIALTIWGVILLILGIREVHGFSTGRAAAVVFTPVAAMAVLVVITIIIMASVITSIPSLDQWRFM